MNNKKRGKRELRKKSLKKLFNDEISLCMYLKKIKNQVHIIVKDTGSEAIVFDEKFDCSKKNVIHDGHKISDKVIPALTGEKGISLSSLAYCKQLSPQKKIICISDYACRKEKRLIPRYKVNVAPRWHSKAPYLFYSQFTKTKCRLMAFNIKAKRERVICSYDGMNMQPSFSPDGVQVVLCMSGKRGNSELYLYDQRLCRKLKKKIFRQITWNRGNNSSPCLLPNSDIVFCSDFQTGNPQLYYYRKNEQKVLRLSNGCSYCAAPAYSEEMNALVYTRYIKGNFQLFTMSFTDQGIVERQCTFCSGDKLDASWSPCGRYIAFTFDYKDTKTQKKTAQIAALNCRSGRIRVLTNDAYPKSFPAWGSASYYHM